MPDISALNGTAIDNVAEFDGLTVTDVPAIAAPAAAYSVRLLDTAVGVPTYTGSAMRVRRVTGAGNDGNDDEADVGYDSNNELSLESPVSNFSAGGSNATTLGEFLNVGTVNSITYTDADSLSPNTAAAYVNEWKDQSGNANDAEQTAFGSQPPIHNGTVNTDLLKENGKPFLKFRGGNSGNESLTMGSSVTAETVFSVVANDTPGFLAYYTWSSGALGFFSGGTISGYTGPGVASGASAGYIVGTETGQTLLYNDYNGTGWEVGQDGGTASQVLVTGAKAIDQVVRPSTNLQVEKFQEIIIYNSDNSTNRTAIEVNTNNYFAIGNFPNPTSGLLFDYPDAAAAYSVRQLANTAALSMRVRRDTAGGTGDDDEADVLFDFTLTDPTISLDSRINNASAGVASTTLGEFLNATGYTDKDNLTVVADGFCDTWYDQSGAGNDAEQTTFGNQPQIFDSASPTDLITDNGKPAVRFKNQDNSGVNRWLDCGDVGDSTGDICTFVVLNHNNATLSNQFGSPFSKTVFAAGASRWSTGPTFAAYVDSSNNQFNVSNQTTRNTQILYAHEALGGDTITMYENGTAQANTGSPSGSVGNNAYHLLVGAYGDSAGNGGAQDSLRGVIQEAIYYNSDQSGHRTAIETDINTYFSIY